VTERTTQSTFDFSAAFSLPGFDGPLPAGAYLVSTEEEGADVAGHLVYRRTATILRVEAAGRVEYHPVDSAALDAAFQRDQEAAARTSGEEVQPQESPALQGKWPWRSIPKWVRSNHAAPKGSNR
jgi:hypothetical protein